MKKKQRKSYTTAFKVKVALEVIKGQRTINEIATHYGVHPNMVTQRIKQAIESLPDVFSTRRERDAQEEETLKADLYQQIGQLKVELDWLKKNLACSIDRFLSVSRHTFVIPKPCQPGEGTRITDRLQSSMAPDYLVKRRKISSLRAISSLVMCLKRGGTIARDVASRAATSSWY